MLFVKNRAYYNQSIIRCSLKNKAGSTQHSGIKGLVILSHQTHLHNECVPHKDVGGIKVRETSRDIHTLTWLRVLKHHTVCTTPHTNTQYPSLVQLFYILSTRSEFEILCTFTNYAIVMSGFINTMSPLFVKLTLHATFLPAAELSHCTCSWEAL